MFKAESGEYIFKYVLNVSYGVIFKKLSSTNQRKIMGYWFYFIIYVNKKVLPSVLLSPSLMRYGLSHWQRMGNGKGGKRLDRLGVERTFYGLLISFVKEQIFLGSCYT